MPTFYTPPPKPCLAILRESSTNEHRVCLAERHAAHLHDDSTPSRPATPREKAYALALWLSDPRLQANAKDVD